VDVNVFIDVLTRRMNWAGSLQVLHLARHVPQLEGWTSTLTIPLSVVIQSQPGAIASAAW
jgi:hypothetical protein